MEETIAELRRQLREVRQARDGERQARDEAQRHVQPNTLFAFLDRCHNSLSQAIRVERDATLTTQGDATNPVNRLYPKRIVPWLDFPNVQEQVWRKLNRSSAFTSHPLFPSNHQLDFFVRIHQNQQIDSEASLRNFERDTVDNFVERAIEALRDDERLRHELKIQGRVTFYDRADPSETLLESSLEQMDVQDSRKPQRHANTGHDGGNGKGRGAAHRQRGAGTARRHNRRANQSCMHLMANERLKPVYVVEYKAPHKVTIPQLVAGLHHIDLARDVIDQEGDTFDFHATCLIAAVVTQIFSYMIDSGVQYGYICTGEAFVFLHIPKHDPTVVQYFLCIPNQDVQADDEWRLHRTAIGQVLAFTLQALAAEAPLQEWHDTAHDELQTWKVEYMDVLREIPETLRKNPPVSNYRPSHWRPESGGHNSRSYARCQPNWSTPKHSPTEGRGSDAELHSPSIVAAARSRGNKHQSTKESESTRPYCTIACIRGIVNQGFLDTECPNWKLHGDQKHSMGPQKFIHQLHNQLARNRNYGFEQIHVCGRTDHLIKATLLSHGYTVIIKATTMEKQHLLQAEVDNYRYLGSLQGHHIPVCLGSFTPRVTYWYHGKLMAQMMILSWSGLQLQHIINDENSEFFHQERDKALTALHSHGVVYGDSEWRNMLWDDICNRLIVIDLEDVKWLRPPPNAKVGNFGQNLLSSPTADCT